MDTELQRYARSAWAKLTPAQQRNISLRQFTDLVNEQFSASYNPVDIMPVFEQLREESP